MASASSSLIRRINANQAIIRFTPSTSYVNGTGEDLSTALAILSDGDTIMNGVIDVRGGPSLNGVLAAEWIWDGGTHLKAFCLVSGVEAANALNVSTSVVNLLVTFI